MTVRKRLKIAVVASGNIPSKYAHSFNVMKMAQGFIQLGHRVEVISLLNLHTLWNYFRIKDISSHYGLQCNITMRLFPDLSLPRVNRQSRLSAYLQSLYCKWKRFDLVFARNYLVTYFAVKMRIPTILETHTTLYDNPDLRLCREVFNLPDFLGMVVINEEIKKAYLKRKVNPEKLMVCEDGVDIERFEVSDDRSYWRKQLGLSLEQPVVTYCGHLYEEKGVEHIFQTAELLSEQGYPALFVVVGGWEKDVDRWSKYCNCRGLTNVLFTGFVNNSLVPGYLKAADVLIMPYNTRVNFHVMDIMTTSPLKLFEYMASNRPIVSTKIPAISKVLVNNENALLAEPNDIGKLAASIRRLCEDKALAKNLASNAFKLAVKFQWKERCRKIIKYFLQL